MRSGLTPETQGPACTVIPHRTPLIASVTRFCVPLIFIFIVSG
jgi:hypothetical protein